MPWWTWFAFPILIGALQPFIIQMTLQLAKVMGDMPASAVLHLVGALAGLLFIGAGLRGGNQAWDTIPWWAWFGGALGVCCLWMLNMTIPRLGIAATFATLVASQLVFSLVVERFGWLGASLREVHWPQLLGVVLLALGAYLVSLR